MVIKWRLVFWSSPDHICVMIQRTVSFVASDVHHNILVSKVRLLFTKRYDICFLVLEMHALNRNFYYASLFLLCVGCEYGDRKTGCKKDQCHTRDHQLNCCKTCGIQSHISQTSSTASVRPTISVSNQNSHPSSLTTRRQSAGPTDMKPIQNVNKHSILPTTTHMIPFSSTRFSLKIGGNRQEGTPTQNKVQELPAWQQKTTPVDELIPDPFAPGYCVKKNAHYRPDVPCEFLAKWLSLCTETRFKNACCQTCNIDRTRRVKRKALL